MSGFTPLFPPMPGDPSFPIAGPESFQLSVPLMDWLFPMLMNGEAPPWGGFAATAQEAANMAESMFYDLANSNDVEIGGLVYKLADNLYAFTIPVSGGQWRPGATDMASSPWEMAPAYDPAGGALDREWHIHVNVPDGRGGYLPVPVIHGFRDIVGPFSGEVVEADLFPGELPRPGDTEGFMRAIQAEFSRRGFPDTVSIYDEVITLSGHKGTYGGTFNRSDAVYWDRGIGRWMPRTMDEMRNKFATTVMGPDGRRRYTLPASYTTFRPAVPARPVPPVINQDWGWWDFWYRTVGEDRLFSPPPDYGRLLWGPPPPANPAQAPGRAPSTVVSVASPPTASGTPTPIYNGDPSCTQPGANAASAYYVEPTIITSDSGGGPAYGGGGGLPPGGGGGAPAPSGSPPGGGEGSIVSGYGVGGPGPNPFPDAYASPSGDPHPPGTWYINVDTGSIVFVLDGQSAGDGNQANGDPPWDAGLGSTGDDGSDSGGEDNLPVLGPPDEDPQSGPDPETPQPMPDEPQTAVGYPTGDSGSVSGAGAPDTSYSNPIIRGPQQPSPGDPAQDAVNGPGWLPPTGYLAGQPWWGPLPPWMGPTGPGDPGEDFTNMGPSINIPLSFAPPPMVIQMRQRSEQLLELFELLGGQGFLDQYGLVGFNDSLAYGMGELASAMEEQAMLGWIGPMLPPDSLGVRLVCVPTGIGHSVDCYYTEYLKNPSNPFPQSVKATEMGPASPSPPHWGDPADDGGTGPSQGGGWGGGLGGGGVQPTVGSEDEGGGGVPLPQGSYQPHPGGGGPFQT
jgi:hypothetical protein